MRILNGTDIVELSRIDKAIDKQGEAFVNRVFTAGEQEYCNRLKGSRRIESYGARFAAKEAASKALGTGVMTKGIVMTDFEVQNDDNGAPHLILHGEAEKLAGQIGVTDMSLSLSHDGGYAVAFCSMLIEE